MTDTGTPGGIPEPVAPQPALGIRTTTRPHPYLSRAETDDILETLGFKFVGGHGNEPPRLKDTKKFRKRFAALQKLLAGAIAEWTDMEHPDQGSWDTVVDELSDWTEEYLVG